MNCSYRSETSNFRSKTCPRAEQTDADDLSLLLLRTDVSSRGGVKSVTQSRWNSCLRSDKSVGFLRLLILGDNTRLMELVVTTDDGFDSFWQVTRFNPSKKITFKVAVI